MTGFFWADTSMCVGKLAEDEDDDCKDGEDVLDRSDRFANAAVVFSRAIAAMDKRLCLERLEDVDLAESRKRADCGSDDKEDEVE